MAVAIATGGPGALVWMWVMAFLGAAIQYASCILSVMFRQQTKEGEFVGGPMYYLRDGLGYKGMAFLFPFLLFSAPSPWATSRRSTPSSSPCKRWAWIRFTAVWPSACWSGSSSWEASADRQLCLVCRPFQSPYLLRNSFCYHRFKY